MAVTKVRSKQQLEVNDHVTFSDLYRITNLVDGVNPQDAATVAQLTAVQSGLDVKGSVRAATTAAITLSGTQTVDGVALSAGDRVLVKDQGTASANGIYVVSAGAWTRSTDADTSAEVSAGMYTWVEEGTANGDSGWLLTTNNPITLGTTSLTFTQFSGAGQITAGLGLTKTGNTLDVNVGTGLEIVSDAVKLTDTGVTAAVYGSTGFNVSQITVDSNGRITTASNRDMFGSALTANTVFAAPNGSSGAPTFRALVAADLPVVTAVKGGTGQSSYAVGDLLYADTTTTLAKLADIATGNVLISGGVNTAPSWGKVALTTHVSGILPIANGGTALSTAPTTGQVLIGTSGGAYALATLTQGTGITITSGSGSITIAISGTVLTSTNYVVRETPSGTVNGTNPTFTLANTPVAGTEQIYVNGILMDSGSGNDYTISGATITFLTGAIPLTNDKIRVTYFK